LFRKLCFSCFGVAIQRSKRKRRWPVQPYTVVCHTFSR